jgi:hypothetical protein
MRLSPKALWLSVPRKPATKKRAHQVFKSHDERALLTTGDLQIRSGSVHPASTPHDNCRRRERREAYPALHAEAVSDDQQSPRLLFAVTITVILVASIPQQLPLDLEEHQAQAQQKFRLRARNHDQSIQKWLTTSKRHAARRAFKFCSISTQVVSPQTVD